MKKKMSGKQAVMEMLKAEGVTHIFGNPGTSEGPLIDTVSYTHLTLPTILHV